MSPTLLLAADSLEFTKLFYVQLIPIAGYMLILAGVGVGYYRSKISLKTAWFVGQNVLWFFFIGLFSLSIVESMVGIVACSYQGSYNSIYADSAVSCDDSATRNVLIYSFITPLFAILCVIGPLLLTQHILKTESKPVRTQTERTHPQTIRPCTEIALEMFSDSEYTKISLDDDVEVEDIR